MATVTETRVRPDYAVVIEMDGELQVLAEASTAAAAVEAGKQYPGSRLASKDGRGWRLL